MLRRIKVSFNGEIVDGEELDFTRAREDWNLYDCQDGTRTTVKFVVQKSSGWIRYTGQRRRGASA
jgi:hypothetical protein